MKTVRPMSQLSDVVVKLTSKNGDKYEIYLVDVDTDTTSSANGLGSMHLWGHYIKIERNGETLVEG